MGTGASNVQKDYIYKIITLINGTMKILQNLKLTRSLDKTYTHGYATMNREFKFKIHVILMLI